MSDYKTAVPGSIWRITGTYRTDGSFTDCLAIVLNPSIHGTDETVFSMLPPLAWFGESNRLILPEQIASAVLVIEDPWEDQPVRVYQHGRPELYCMGCDHYHASTVDCSPVGRPGARYIIDTGYADVSGTDTTSPDPQGGHTAGEVRS